MDYNKKMKTCAKKHHISECKTCWMEKRYSIFRGHQTRCLCHFSIPELEKIRQLLLKFEWHIKQFTLTKSLFHINEAMKSKMNALIWLKVGDNFFLSDLIPTLKSLDIKEKEKWVKDCKEISTIFSDKMLACVIKMENFNKTMEIPDTIF